MPLIVCPESVHPELRKLLAKIMSSENCRGFSLGGGTSLTIRFGYRTSTDLDFFTIEPFDSMQLERFIVQQFPDGQIVNRTRGSLCVFVNGMKMEFFHHPYPLLEKPDKEDIYRLFSVRDISAMKINAVTNRGSKKDFIDLYALHEQGIKLSDSLENFREKYNGNKLLALRSLLWFKEADTEPDPVFLNDWSWETVRGRMEQLAAELI